MARKNTAPAPDSFEAFIGALLAYEQHYQQCQFCGGIEYCRDGYLLMVDAAKAAGAERNREEQALTSCPVCSGKLCPHLRCRFCGNCPRCSALGALALYNSQRKGNGKR